MVEAERWCLEPSRTVRSSGKMCRIRHCVRLHKLWMPLSPRLAARLIAPACLPVVKFLSSTSKGNPTRFPSLLRDGRMSALRARPGKCRSGGMSNSCLIVPTASVAGRIRRLKTRISVTSIGKKSFGWWRWHEPQGGWLSRSGETSAACLIAWEFVAEERYYELRSFSSASASYQISLSVNYAWLASREWTRRNSLTSGSYAPRLSSYWRKHCSFVSVICPCPAASNLDTFSGWIVL